MTKTYFRSALYLSFAGTLFAGYLSARKLITNTCAFNESCPYFLGYPACWYGFGMFFLMFITSVAALNEWIKAQTARMIILIISLVGIVFAGQYVIRDIGAMMNGARFGMGLPTCAYGLIFYIIIFILSVRKK